MPLRAHPHRQVSPGAESNLFLNETVFTAKNDPLQLFWPESEALKTAEVPELILNEYVADELADTAAVQPPAAMAPPRDIPAGNRSWAAAISAVHLPRVNTSLISFVGGAAIGALAVWFIAVQPVPQPGISEPSIAQHPVTAVEPASIPGSAAARDIALPGTPLPPGSRPANVPDTSTPTPAGGSSGRERGTRPAVTLPKAAARAVVAKAGTAVESTTGFRGSLVVNSDPPGAQVFVGGEPAGSTPLELKAIPVGSRAIRIEAAGYQKWSAAVRVVANQRTQVTATLTR